MRGQSGTPGSRLPGRDLRSVAIAGRGPGLDGLGLLPELADVLDRVDLLPDLAPQPAEPIGRPCGTATQHQLIVAHLDRQAVPGLDTQAPSCLAWQ